MSRERKVWPEGYLATDPQTGIGRNVDTEIVLHHPPIAWHVDLWWGALQFDLYEGSRVPNLLQRWVLRLLGIRWERRDDHPAAELT